MTQAQHRGAQDSGAGADSRKAWHNRGAAKMPGMRTLLAALLLPPTGPLLLGLLALWIRAALWRRLALGGSVLLFWLCASEGVMAPLARAWAPPAEPPLALLNVAEHRARTLVLVLGAGVRAGSGPMGEYEPKLETLERLLRGAWWARQYQLPLAFSGGRSPNALPEQPSEAAVARRVLAQQFGLQLDWTEEHSGNTAENARFSAAILQQRGVRRVVLVTHALHMPRALRHFRAAAPTIEFLPAPLSRQPSEPWRLQEFLPSVEGLRLGRYLAYEWLANLSIRK